MTTDTQIAELANALILDMYQCHKQGIFKGYINWFASSYQLAVEARRQMEDFRRMVTVNKPVSSGPTTALIPRLTGYVEVPIPEEIKTTVTVASKPFKQVIKMHMPAKTSDVLYDTPDEPKTQDQSPSTVKFHPDGSVEYGYDSTKGTAEQAARDLVKRYTDVWGADSVATIPHEPKGTLSTGTPAPTSKSEQA